MDYRVTVKVKSFPNIMTVVVAMIISSKLYLLTFFGLRAMNVNIAPATTAVPITPIIPATPTDARSFSIPLTP
jgi:hypothetical protein